jgi:hypothetical protein
MRELQLRRQPGRQTSHVTHVTCHTRHTSHTSHATQMHLGRSHSGGKHRRAHASPGSQRRRNICTAPPLDVPQQQAFPPSSSSSFTGKEAQRVGGVKEPDAVLFSVLQREERGWSARNTKRRVMRTAKKVREAEGHECATCCSCWSTCGGRKPAQRSRSTNTCRKSHTVGARMHQPSACSSAASASLSCSGPTSNSAAYSRAFGTGPSTMNLKLCNKERYRCAGKTCVIYIKGCVRRGGMQPQAPESCGAEAGWCTAAPRGGRRRMEAAAARGTRWDSGRGEWR